MAELDKVYDPQSVEPEMFALWEESGAFDSTPTGTPHERTFSIVIPPPNVTGALHLGHALNNVLQDILVRYHRMRGFNTLWQPGTDHAGIATQAVVEKRIRESEGKTRHEIGRDELVRRIWEWKDQYEQRILSQLKLMGCSCDWKRNRFTLDDGLARAVRQQFFKLFRDGLIFRGKRLVNWDTQLQTAVSDDELKHELVKGHFWHFTYPVIDPQPGEPDHVIIATTRPETMLGDVAVAVHPDPEGFFDESEAQLREVLSAAGEKNRDEIQAKLVALAERRESHLPRLRTLRDMAKDGRKLRLPLVEREIPLITDEWANPSLGSGCVKITPAHDPNDYEVGGRASLPMINVLTPDGKIAKIIEPDGSSNPHGADYEGLSFTSEGRAKVVADLEARGLVDRIEDRETEIGHSDRSGIPIEPFLSDQWFIQTGDVAFPEPRASARADTEMPSSEPRASARAESRMPDLSGGATLVTWTTYGSWLPGDERGYVSRSPRSDGTHDLQNQHGEPYDADDPQVLSSASDRMEGSAVYLDRADAAVVLSAMAHTCERHAVELLAVAIMRDHVHVLCQSELSGSELLQLLKGNASHQLTKDKLGTESPRWWTRSGSSRSMKSGSDLTAAIDYVKNQSHPLAVWSFDMTDGESVELVESARAEARGSLENPPGIRLGDGSNVKGLAQAAMDAVTDRCIQVFPARYAKSYLDWLGEKRDWCISRQLWWGHRIAVWEARFLGGGGAKSIAEMRSWQRDKIDALQAELDEMAQKLRLRGRYVVRAQRDLPPNVCFICTSVDDAEDALESVSADLARQQQTGRIEYRAHSLRVKALISDLRQDEDVLDTWFSAGLWPFSTLGWPEDTEHLKQYYPTSVLVTSRDIITNWVARMVMFGLYSMGKVPFDRVYITPKVLDGRGETMSKSKGNGVDPVDIIHTYGADALRYSIADLTTETQDIRMPVDYLCPHCGKLTEQMLALKAEGQARKSRGDKLDRKIQPADCHEVRCAQCKESFATQWADDGLKAKLGVGRETSERFEIGRNFANKLWNAARFAFMNLADVPCERIDVGSLPPEDRWILAKLSQTIRGYHAHLSGYEFAASVKDLRDFFWDSLCDWYIELTKPRLVDDAAAENSASAKQVLAFCLDQVLRLWHPTMPFITERLWRELNEIAPNRGLPGIAELESENQLVTAEFPPVDGYLQLDDAELIEVFAGIQDFVRTVRDLRSSCDVPPRERVTITVVASDDQADAFRQYAHIVRRMAGVAELRVDPAATRPKNAASASVGGLRVYVHGISDDAAERTRTEKSLADLDRQITGKRGKLSNEKFVANAKPEVVEAERHRLAELESQASALHAHLAELDS